MSAQVKSRAVSYQNPLSNITLVLDPFGRILAQINELSRSIGLRQDPNPIYHSHFGLALLFDMQTSLWLLI